MADCFEVLQQRVDAEFEEFKAKMLAKSKEEIFRANSDIRFYQEMTEFLTQTSEGYLDEDDVEKLSRIDGNILEWLFAYYVEDEYATIHYWEDISRWVREFCKVCLKEDVKNESC